MILATPASAADATRAQRAACKPDVFRLCASDIPNVANIIVCLKRERPRLGTACRSVMDDADKKVTKAATRSLRTAPGWCRFDATDGSADDDWRTWCASAAKAD